MSKYTVVTYQPLKGPRVKYWVPTESSLNNLLEDITQGNPDCRCTREPIQNGVLRLKGSDENICFLESALEHEYGLEEHFSKKKHITYDVVPLTDKSKKVLENEIRDCKEQARRYEQLSNLSAGMVIPQIELSSEELRRKPRIDLEDEANLELILKQ